MVCQCWTLYCQDGALLCVCFVLVIIISYVTLSVHDINPQSNLVFQSLQKNTLRNEIYRNYLMKKNEKNAKKKKKGGRNATHKNDKELLNRRLSDDPHMCICSSEHATVDTIFHFFLHFSSVRCSRVVQLICFWFLLDLWFLLHRHLLIVLFRCLLAYNWRLATNTRVHFVKTKKTDHMTQANR